jgi:hypothetical protein
MTHLMNIFHIVTTEIVLAYQASREIGCTMLITVDLILIGPLCDQENLLYLIHNLKNKMITDPWNKS